MNAGIASTRHELNARPAPSAARLTPLLLAACVFAAYNLNGREMPSYDSQPTKFAARALALEGTLALDTIVAELPGLAERPGFAVARDGHWRSRYPAAPAIVGGAVGYVLHQAGAVDLRAVYSANIVAKVTASALVTLAVVLAYGIARGLATPRIAAAVALGFGLGTGLWSTASQTLWQHEIVLASLTGALAILSSTWRVRRAGALAVAALLGIALAGRLQVLPAVGVLAALLIVDRPPRRVWVLAPMLLVLVTLVASNIAWFGHPLGGAAALEQLHTTVHSTPSSLNARPWEGFAGLLVSPNRGLLVYSPIVLIACLGLPAAWRRGKASLPFVCILAAGVQIAAYALYSVWWGGHTYGPRYLIDVLPLLIPAAALGASVAARRMWTAAGAVMLLVWSVAVAATGAFCYPAERWNTLPVNVDNHHERLWDWRDMQILRCWQTGLSPQNFDFFRAANFGTRRSAFAGPHAQTRTGRSSPDAYTVPVASERTAHTISARR